MHLPPFLQEERVRRHRLCVIKAIPFGSVAPGALKYGPDAAGLAPAAFF